MVDMQSDALLQYLNMQRAQEPAFIDADGNPIPPRLDLDPNIYELAQGGLHFLLRPQMLEGLAQNGEEPEEEYSLHMHSELPPIRNNSSFVHRRNYSHDNI